jgi:hypothetical protein
MTPKPNPYNLEIQTVGQLKQGLDNALADLTLAERYEHNYHLIPAIQRYIDAVQDELAARGEAPPLLH